MGGEPAKLFDAFVLSGFVEELAKWVVLIAAVYHWDEFDEPLDGVVYGVAVALGFATLENLLFVARLGLGVAWMRALFAVPAHALFGATMGYYAGRAKFDRGGKLWRDRALCLFAPDLLPWQLRLRAPPRYGRARLDRDLVAVRGVMDVCSAPRPPRPARVTFSHRRGGLIRYDLQMRLSAAVLVAGLTALGCTKKSDESKARLRRRPSSTRSGRRWRTRSSRSSTSRTIAVKG